MKFFLIVLLMLAPVTASAEMPAEMNSNTRECQATVESIETDEEADGLRHVVFEARDEDGVAYTIDTADSYVEGLRFDLREGQKILLQKVVIAGEPDGVYF